MSNFFPVKRARASYPVASGRMPAFSSIVDRGRERDASETATPETRFRRGADCRADDNAKIISVFTRDTMGTRCQETRREPPRARGGSSGTCSVGDRTRADFSSFDHASRRRGIAGDSEIAYARIGKCKHYSRVTPVRFGPRCRESFISRAIAIVNIVPKLSSLDVASERANETRLFLYLSFFLSSR